MHHVHENNTDAYLLWRKQAISAATLVHIDNHLDLEWLPGVALDAILSSSNEALAGLVRDPQDLVSIPSRPLDFKNFVYPAIRGGILARIYWVVPDESVAEHAAEYRRTLLEGMRRWNLEELAAFRVVDGRCETAVFGVPLTICSLTLLPTFSEPVLLDVDFDYFDSPGRAPESLVPYMWPEPFVRLLHQRIPKSSLITTCFSMRGGYLDPALRYAAEEVDHWIAQGGSPNPERFARFQQAVSQAARGEVAGAASEFESLAADTEAPASLIYAAGRYFRTIGEVSKAVDCFQQAGKMNNAFMSSALWEADSLMQKGLYERAIDAYRLQSQADGSPYLRYNLGLCLSMSGQRQSAVKELASVCQDLPESIYAFHQLGVALFDSGQTEEALEAFSKIVTLDPENALAHAGIANCFVVMGRHPQAAQSFRKALALNPTDATVHAALAHLDERSRHPEEALKGYERALWIEPEFPRVREQLERLRRRLPCPA